MINAKIDYSEMSNTAIIGLIGKYVKQQRLDKNITQEQVAEDAGVNRWTVGKIERGDSITLLSLIQILRALDLLNVFEKFQYERKISPIEMVKFESTKIRARGKNTTDKDKSEW